MNGALKWKLAFGFLLVFVAGGVTGYLGALHARRIVFEFHHRGSVAEGMRHHLQSDVGLSAEQLQTLAPVIDRTAAELERIRRESGKQVAETFEAAHREIEPVLTPNQRARLQELRRKHQRHAFSAGEPPMPPP